MLAPLIFNICSQYDIVSVRMKVREAARLIGMDLSDQARISLATSSLMERCGSVFGSGSGSITIECLREAQNTGLRVVYTFSNSREQHLENMADGNVSWMVDTLAIRNLASGQVEITLTKWVKRKQS
jgi:anti-sigma regulatory factor (Ser/Thr protein kinase)